MQGIDEQALGDPATAAQAYDAIMHHVSGGAEMGAYATALPGGLDVTAANAESLGARWGFRVPGAPGLTAPEMVEAAADGSLDVLWSSGGNFLDVLPDPDAVRAALGITST
jgi:predicted molibdopterin-dependent oxidoreductase YjgC